MDLVSVVILGFFALALGFVFYCLGRKMNLESECSRYGGKNDRPAEQAADHLLAKTDMS